MRAPAFSSLSFALLLLLEFVAGVSAVRNVTLSNVALPRDQNGAEILTGEASVMAYGGLYYFYLNNWGGCPGIDCCDSPGGCASCCFNPPTAQYNDTCVYTGNHSVVVYSTADFAAWTYEGVALPLENRLPGIEFRPQVVFNGTMFLMWYEDRWTRQRGYALAASKTPVGPFVTIADTVHMPGQGRVGDYDVFVDDDGSAYHVRTGLTIVKLAPNMSAASNETPYEIPMPGVEGPSMFKRDGRYYVLAGNGCCACLGGSNVDVYMAPSPQGPYKFLGDVGSNPGRPQPPNLYVTRAQGSKVFPVTTADGSTVLLWVGNQWVTSQAPGRPRNNDLLYFTVLDFNPDGSIVQLQWHDNITLSMP